MPKITPPLDEFDRAVLLERGIALDTAYRNRLRTDGGALVIPYADLRTGTFNCYALRRLHKPPVRDGKPVKYLAPTGEPSRPYFPAECRTALLDLTSDLYLTEGPLKALALAQIGCAAVAIQGVWNWKVAGTDELLPDLAVVPLAARVVYLVFDHDEKPDTRRQVAEARRRLARALLKAGAHEVRNVELPPGPDGSKQGVDDFLVAHGVEAFRELVAEAQPLTPAVTAVIPLTKPEGRTDTANAARLVAKYGEDVRWVGPWDKWLLWDGQRWKHDDRLGIDLRAKDVAADLFTEVAALLKAGSLPDDRARAAVHAHARYSNNKDGIRNMIALTKSTLAIGPEQLDRNPWLLTVENGTLDLRTSELRDHRREDDITKLAPVVFDPATTCPRWERFLDKIFAGNVELIGYMRRLVGYALTGDTSEHILPFLYGTGAREREEYVL